MKKERQLQRNDLVYPELCYRLLGILFDVHNTIGYGYAEKTYQKAVAAALKDAGIEYIEQLYVPVEYKSVKVSSNYFDFLVQGKVILELKKGDRFAKTHIDQLYQYLKARNLKLGILAYFGPNKLHYKRILNLENDS